jgi:hypothetical protein
MPRGNESVEPIMQHTRDYWERLRELRSSHPHIPVHELQHFLNHPPSFDAPAKPTPEPPKERTQAQRLWPYLE